MSEKHPGSSRLAQLLEHAEHDIDRILREEAHLIERMERFLRELHHRRPKQFLQVTGVILSPA